VIKRRQRELSQSCWIRDTDQEAVDSRKVETKEKEWTLSLMTLRIELSAGLRKTWKLAGAHPIVGEVTRKIPQCQAIPMDTNGKEAGLARRHVAKF